MMGIEWLKPGVVFGSILFALIGVGIFWLCFVIIDKLTPYHLWDEIIEKKNVALAIVVASAGAQAAAPTAATPAAAVATNEQSTLAGGPT